MTIQADRLQLRHNSKIATTAGGSGNGGDINLNTNTLVTLENSNIAANAFFGRGGNIQINTEGIFVDPDSMITASSSRGINGVVAVTNFGLDFKNALTPVTNNLIGTEDAIAGSCLARRNVEQGTFVVTGTGGLAPTPYNALTSQYTITEIKPIQPTVGAADSAPSMATTAPWKIGDPIVEARALVRTADGRILLTTLPPGATAPADNLVCHPQENQG
jgi:large exoprotein involved in heme utilization and adhesion